MLNQNFKKLTKYSGFWIKWWFANENPNMELKWVKMLGFRFCSSLRMICLANVGKEKKYLLCGSLKYIFQTSIHLKIKLFIWGLKVLNLLILSKAKITQN